jgi:predicted GNAT superfamily acetyltransferase
MAETVDLRLMEKPEEMHLVEELQRQVWAGNETEVAPAHVLLAGAHNGGLLVGAFAQGDNPGEERLVGFVFGFPGLIFTPDGPQPKHCSHMMGVHPDYRDHGLGFALKRAQWQIVRSQGLDLITWTYDPLLSRNAYLNIAKLGAVCNTYRRDEYGELRDEMNRGMSSDRFQVDWWVNSARVNRRLSRRPRAQLDYAQYAAGGAPVINPAAQSSGGWPAPVELDPTSLPPPESAPLLMLEIPSDFLALKAADFPLAVAWRKHTRLLFEHLFQQGYLVTDLVFQSRPVPRSLYILSYGDSTL